MITQNAAVGKTVTTGATKAGNGAAQIKRKTYESTSQANTAIRVPPGRSTVVVEHFNHVCDTNTATPASIYHATPPQRIDYSFV